MERITEQRLKNKRFRNTETIILIKLLSVKTLLSPERLIKIVGISRSTLYRHHKNIHEIVPDYEKYILRKCKNTMSRLMRIKNIHLRTLFHQLLLFMSANQLVMKFLLKYDNNDLIERIIITLKPRILTTGKIKDGEIFTIYIKEVSGLVKAWCDSGFNKSDIDSILNKIMYLTNTARFRLSPLSSFNCKSVR